MNRRRNPVLTFIDTSVLITAWRSGDPGLKIKALTVLSDSNRSYAASDFVELEVMPKAVYHKQHIEQAFYQRFFNRLTVKVQNRRGLEADAFDIAVRFGLSAMDALHIAAAIEIQAEEFITAERSNSPLLRVRGVKVISIR
jgi:predicted nucleic acid-binding protein